jgi:hypothetical protein
MRYHGSRRIGVDILAIGCDIAYDIELVKALIPDRATEEVVEVAEV